MICNTTCTGCGACLAACPKGCITMEKDSLEQWLPRIHERSCVHCDVCKKVCPQNQPPEKQRPVACYAAWSREAEDVRHSASGGAAAVFARWQMQNGGAVFGCDYSPEADLRHFRLMNEGDIERARGSKYSRSEAWGCFGEIRSLLRQNTQVLFIGTPCQVAGLVKFLGRNRQGLVTVDLVCHGTPPNDYLKQHLRKLPLPAERIRFRGEFDKMLTVVKDGRICYQKNKNEDAYFRAFYDNCISYESCYTCPYAGPERVADITIGDFWGMGELQTMEAKSQRPSLILLNTEQGRRFFENAAEGLHWEERPVEEGVLGNGRLNKAPGKSKKATIFQTVYKVRKDFDAAWKLTGHIENLWNKAARAKYRLVHGRGERK